MAATTKIVKPSVTYPKAPPAPIKEPPPQKLPGIPRP